MRIYRKLPLLLGMALAAPLFGCDADHTGSGHWAEEFRAASDFDRIEVSGAVDLFVEVDPNAEAELVVAGDDNLLLHVETEISGGTLHVDTDGWLNPQFPLEVWVKARNLRGLDLCGASGVTAWGISSNRLDVDVSGASAVRYFGPVQDVQQDASGASEVAFGGTDTGSGSSTDTGSGSGSGSGSSSGSGGNGYQGGDDGCDSQTVDVCRRRR